MASNQEILERTFDDLYERLAEQFKKAYENKDVELFNKLQQLLLQLEKSKPEIVNNVIMKFNKSIGNDAFNAIDLRNPANQHLFIASLACEMLGKKSDKFNYDFLFKPLSNDRKELEKNLKNDIQKLLHGLNEFLPPGNKLSQEFIDQQAEYVAKRCSEELKPEHERLCESKEVLNLLEEQLSTCLRLMFGGDDPRFVGEVQGPLFGEVPGNSNAWIAQGQVSMVDPSVIAKQARRDAGQYDFIGADMLATIGNTAQGLEAEAGYTAMRPDPFNTKPTH